MSSNHNNMKNEKWVYCFGEGKAEGDGNMKNLLGGKGANLAQMSLLGLNIPPGFTVTTQVCSHFYGNGNKYPESLEVAVKENIKKLESITGRGFGDKDNPLLLSVRSGARMSMPGMMDTILNLGLNSETVEGLAKSSNDPKFAYDSYRRFLQMFGDVVMKIPHELFEAELSAIKKKTNCSIDSQLSEDSLKTLVENYKGIIEANSDTPFPEDVEEQLWAAISAVFLSWMNKRAVRYRSMNCYPDSWGTAVTVQAMVFGNMGETSATGVAFTRDPSDGRNVFYGEYLVNAQGEDVVAGIRTPACITKLSREEEDSNLPSMEESMGDVFGQLLKVGNTLESFYGDMQEIEFTVENGKLYLLQTRRGKRTVTAALKIALDMVNNGEITKEQALMNVDSDSLEKLLHSRISPDAQKEVFASGMPASPGAASGMIVFNADDAEKLTNQGKDVILCRKETSPEDIHGMHASRGILTCFGGKTSHAAVVARSIGRPCICGAEDIEIDMENGVLSNKEGVSLKEGDFITLDGASGEVFLGKVPTIDSELSESFGYVNAWSGELKRLEVRANAETPDECRTAIKLGAEGIGLCRTEHMFFEASRLLAVRRMILADTKEERALSLKDILPMQQGDFEEIFTITEGRPVNIRLLDIPLHEFLPKDDEDIESVAKEIGVEPIVVRKRLENMKEINPMLGKRGCRLGVSHPEIYRMQVQAILQAAKSVGSKLGIKIIPEIMIPLVSGVRELAWVKRVIDDTAQDLNMGVEYKIGTMMELPRACFRAGQIASMVDFFSFGTNDLTQTIFGFSRDDTAQIIASYAKKGILEDPFATIDIEGVGAMIKIAVDAGRKANENLKISICGEHGGDPKSIVFCNLLGLDCISCSPMRIPTARLGAAHANISAK